MKRMLVFSVGLLPVFAGWAAGPDDAIRPGDYRPPIRVACLGDSITFGVGADAGWSWPEQLDRMLGDGWDVRNYGHSGATVNKEEKHTIWSQEEYKQALAFHPDVVLIMLGSNDTKPDYWAKKDQFPVLYRQLAGTFRKLSSQPRIFCCTPPFVAKNGAFGINEAGVREEVVMLQALAAEEKLGLIDVHAATENHAELFKDNVHPLTEGATAIARAVYQGLAGKDWAGAIPPLEAAKKDKAPILEIANAGELTYPETFALLLLGPGAPSEKLAPLRARFAATAWELEQQFAALEARIAADDHLRMKYKYALPKLAGEYKSEEGKLREEVEKLRRDRIEELIDLAPAESRAAFGAGWLNKFVMERLTPVAASLTAEQKQKIAALCGEKGAAFGRINNTPERTVEREEVYKQVYQTILDPEQRKRVEPK